jgi:glycosyltransferase involved in cell wall biosynthesis
MSVRISIAMATYNGSKYLSEQLRSFVAQTRWPDELVITDDGSTDTTPQIIEEFATSAPFEVVYSNNEKNLGYAGNFNAALRKTTGDLVFLSDQDDVWLPEKIAYMTELSNRRPDKLMLMNDAILTDGELNEAGLTKLGQIRSAGLSDRAFVMGCCCAVRRQLLDLCLPIPESYTSHDAWIAGFADGLEAKFICERPLQFYRRHGANESSFLVNSTSKVTRWDIYRNVLKRSDDPSNPDREKKNLKQLDLFLQGVVRALERKNGNYTKQLQALVVTTQAELADQRVRMAIRSKRFLPRLALVLNNLRKGGYRRASGVKSALRDLIG